MVKKLQILIVEDDEVVLKGILRRIKRQSGVEISYDFARSIDEAFRKFQEKKGSYDLIITDNNLRDGYGKDGGSYFAREIKKQYQGVIYLHSGSYIAEENKMNKEGIFTGSKEEINNLNKIVSYAIKLKESTPKYIG